MNFSFRGCLVKVYSIPEYFFISIHFPLHRLPIRCLKTLSYHYQILTSKTLKRQPFLTSFDSGIRPLHPRSVFVDKGKPYSFESSFALSYMPKRHHQWNLLILLVKKSDGDSNETNQPLKWNINHFHKQKVNKRINPKISIL
ncbi:hypothetical protein E1A91_D08G093000v1 [Gossypium mustelinum]|uniref:Uncharacterized protein n=1 Tax=Gossypium mustelinum TaxID=34275 RepID=A0A5D2TWB5_GOSMU|nr:hypothetical protein E1A91_D08G093000v1 [Gossypium mustelinum]